MVTVAVLLGGYIILLRFIFPLLDLFSKKPREIGESMVPKIETKSLPVAADPSSDGEDAVAKLKASRQQPLSLDSLRKAIPAAAFEKNLLKSLSYMVFDYAMLGGAFFTMYTLRNSSVWSHIPWLLQWAISIVYWNVAGFFMWYV